MKYPAHEERSARKLARSIVLLGAAMLAASIPLPASAADSVKQVLFICERGNVKSLMAAAYFNQLATERKLPLRAISRGIAPNSTSVPPAIVAGLRAEGIEVDDYRPIALRPEEAALSSHVVTIGAELPQPLQAGSGTRERWDDVPAASTNYAAARASLQAHVRELIERLSNQASP